MENRAGSTGFRKGRPTSPRLAEHGPATSVCDDVDGDGRKEVVSEVNGTWNRISVWAEDGSPRLMSTWGGGAASGAQRDRPGPRGPERGWQEEILAGTSGGW